MTQMFLSRFRSQVGQQLQTVVFVVGIVVMGMGNSAMAQERLLRTLTVSGSGVERIATTMSQIQLGVEIQGKTAQEVQEELARRSSAVVELLRSRNVEKLQTTGIQLNPVYSYEDNVQRLKGYSGTNTVSFRVANERAGSILDEAVKAGATRIDGVSFSASESAISDAQKQALREATQDAQQQADAVLSVLNLSRKDIVNIQINGATPPPPMLVRLEKNIAAGEVAQTPVIGGEQEVQASVTLQISY
ncbi:SIMPL domain-containing protein [Limnofasciculus baicalensis]|uniref:SIMPL domain-containing protein n=1 Tax=Limnofasciculus baicalensis BBK-W-15 TaxID=2699891 RepID=A0AAE3KNS3_9CYAN|nr:SIMPL domain-containing protein [Limnofasciculus baicalensis]MCP2728953.1 SIMPL domain-containing protein [Limnofasciculus baicalensis BBK-W-15]